MERIRIFEKIKGELDDEMRKVKDTKEKMADVQANLHRDIETEQKHWKEAMLKKEEERQRKFEQDKEI